MGRQISDGEGGGMSQLPGKLKGERGGGGWGECYRVQRTRKGGEVGQNKQWKKIHRFVKILSGGK